MASGERWTPAYDRIFDPDHELRGGEPVCKPFAWLDLCHRAAYKTGAMIVSGTLVPLRRGEFVASIRWLGQRWVWDKMKVRRFLEILQDPSVGKLVKVRETPVGTVYRVVSYDSYANPEAGERYTPGPEPRDSKTESTRYTPETPQVGAHERPAVNQTPDRDTPPEPESETETRQQRDKVHTLDIHKAVCVPSESNEAGQNPNSNGIDEADPLSQWLGEFSEVVSGSSLLDPPRTRGSLFKLFGPPGLRANAWRKPDGSQVPEEQRPRILALALTSYESEGNRRLVASEFAGLLRRVIHDEASANTRKRDFGDETKRDRDRAERSRRRSTEIERVAASSVQAEVDDLSAWYEALVDSEREAVDRAVSSHLDAAKGAGETARRAMRSSVWLKLRREGVGSGSWFESQDSETRSELIREAHRRVEALKASGVNVTDETRRNALRAAVERRRGE